ncbi:ribonuclease H-like domain-containing protein, partial [Tanacetum coccineum]
MKLPDGYFPVNDNRVCRPKKSLYGLKQAPRQWNEKLASALIENGFSQSKPDYSLYTKTDKDVFVALLVYVTDIIISGNSLSESEKFKTFLKTNVMIKDLRKFKYFLGIEVIDTDEGICLNQRDLLSEYGSPSLGIHVTKNSCMTLKAYSNADWAKCIVTRKSVTSIELLLLLPVNNSAIKIAANPIFHERTKHLKIDLHLVREKILNGVVKTVKVNSTNQIADILTKGLDTMQHK